jgi:predicted esterase
LIPIGESAADVPNGAQAAMLAQTGRSAMTQDEYQAAWNELERELVKFLEVFEEIHENLRLGDVKDSQARLVGAVGATFRRFEKEFAPLAPPEEFKDRHERICAAATEFGKSCNLFMAPPNRDWTLAFLYSRRAFCSGLYQLYELRELMPLADAHFLSAGAAAPRTTDRPAGSAPAGFTQHPRDDSRSDYTLYIPEDYAPGAPMPLVVALHGGYGQGSEYIWTWIRPARSRRWALLAPKSWGNTWEMTLRSSDARSVLTMIDEVARDYPIDPSQIYLSGLSDGGIFTYILGLEHHERFRGIAPVAGALHMAADPMLREGRGKDTPIFVIHGVHDFIFPVALTRQTNELLSAIGYNLKYEELPEWGHAFPYSINEKLVAPWFEALPPKSA